MRYKLGLFGTHGTGKTKLVHTVAGRLKEYDLNVRAITEIATLAKERGLPIDQNTTLEAQAWIFHRQCSAEHEGNIYGYDITACDRTVFDNYCYLKRQIGEHQHYLEMVLNHAKMHPYNKLYYTPVIERLNPKGRDPDPKFQKEIDKLILDFFDHNRIDHIKLPDERNDWAGIIVDQTLKDLKRYPDG